MTASAQTPCPRCGAAATGNFCASCGSPLGAPKCVSCGAALAADAKFCHVCGAAAARTPSAGSPAHHQTTPAAAKDRTPWLVAGLMVVVIIVAVGYSATKRGQPTAPIMANAGNAGAGGGADPNVLGTTMVAPNIDSMTPKERFLRLETRIDQQLERRDTTRLTFFMQMALQAYALLPESDRDIDVRFHAAMLQTQSGMMPTARALADTIMKSSPDNLLGYVIRATAAADSAKAKAARADFRAHYDAEMKKHRPEYVEHRTLLEQYRKGDGSN